MFTRFSVQFNLKEKFCNSNHESSFPGVHFPVVSTRHESNSIETDALNCISSCLLKVSCLRKENIREQTNLQAYTCKFFHQLQQEGCGTENQTRVDKNQQNFNFPSSIIKINLIIFLWILLVNELKVPRPPPFRILSPQTAVSDEKINFRWCAKCGNFFLCWLN